MSVSHHHADWLSLVEASGPFVSLPVLLRVFPQGLEPRDPSQAKVLRSVYEEWHDNPVAPGKQRAWLLYVLTAVLGYPQNQITEGQALPAGLEANMPEMGETLRPDFALVAPDGSDTAGQGKLLITSYPALQALDRPVIGKHWKATPATRMMELLHGAGVPLGLVTNGEQWMLVYAPQGETTGFTSWYSALWLDEPITLRAFHSLLGVRRFFGVSTDNTLFALLKESAQDQQDVTDQLGYQVREAVEVLVQSFDALDKESNRILLKGVRETTLYEAALTIMMRLVFLFSAEERGLLHLGEPLYDENYAVSTLQEQLQEVADRFGEEVLERRLDAWARLLATFRAVHRGVRHQDLMMQAYGGSLFDPDRYPFLEGRAADTAWDTTTAEPLAVNNRVVLHLLNSLQRLRTKVGTGGTTETRRVSFRALGVEQIGHVYEGLLDHTAVRAKEPVLGLKGTRTKAPEVPLSTLEGKLTEGQDVLIEFLKDETDRSALALRRALGEGAILEEHKIRIACNQDMQLFERVRPFIGIIREDSFDRPLIVPTGSVYVTVGTTRRSTGTHYTPPSLTEPIVQHALEPLVYEGPAKGWLRDRWKLKPPNAILALKVCDMAMGSGAFLVQACRYLAERLVEAWENEENLHPGEVLVTPDGKFSKGVPSERLVPADPNERIAIARRVVADRCLYGVDINPMAVEMAKLSLWLITVDAHRPFTFLDHAFKCGDSLLGIISLEQLENFSLRTGVSKQQSFSTPNLRSYIGEAKKKRESLESMPSDTPEQIVAKAVLYNEAEEAVAKLNAVADVVVALELKGLKGRMYDAEREQLADILMSYWGKGLLDLQDFARQCLSGRVCFHWALAFPEIMGPGGFDAFLGNPPFIGGQKLSGIYGNEYRELLVEIIGRRTRKSADLCAYMFLRAHDLCKTEEACAGLIATNTIAEGGTREVGLDHIIVDSTIYHAVTNLPWPGVAALTVSCVWFKRGGYLGDAVLDGTSVPRIDSSLRSMKTTCNEVFPLKANASLCFQGVIPLGEGFIIPSDEAKEYISRSNYSDIIRPYMTGRILNSQEEMSPKSWIISFFDWPLNRSTAPASYSGQVASDYPDALHRIERLVKPERDKNPRKARRDNWWQFAEKAAGLHREIQRRNPRRILAIVMTAVHFKFEWVSANFIFDQTVVPIILDDEWAFSVLQSSLHLEWAYFQGSSFGAGAAPRYNPSRCFETFPFPNGTLDAVGEIGRNYHLYRSTLQRRRHLGLTQIYNMFHLPTETDNEFFELRKWQMEMDYAVAAAYGWQDLDLAHGFHETKKGIRYTISETARHNVLDRLMALNHHRHVEEDAERAANPATVQMKRGRKMKETDDQMTMDL